MDTIIQIHAPATPDEAAVAEEVAAGGIISDGTARALAALWQSSDHSGRALRLLADGEPITIGQVLKDIELSRAEASSSDSKAELDALERWTLNRRAWVHLPEFLRGVAAWLDVAGLSGLAAELRGLSEVTPDTPDRAAKAVELLESAVRERVAAVEAEARAAAIASLPADADARLQRELETAATRGAHLARDDDLPIVEDHPQAGRLIEVAAYVQRAASRAAAWRMVTGLPKPAGWLWEKDVGDLLRDAHAWVIQHADA